MKNHLTATAVAIVLVSFAVPALAQDIPTPEAVIAMVDTNKDGGIDPMEWAAGPAPIPYPAEADTNHDGKIDLAELTALFAQFQGGGAPPPPA
ncbi:MAG: hypothetical protein JO256_15000, partial [Alphaproteobacteria bacterium]|nr:hypothetical protein [Alphaproteobacteria bacterium]